MKKITVIFLIGIITIMMLHNAVPHEHHEYDNSRKDTLAHYHSHEHGHDHHHSNGEDSQKDNNGIFDLFTIDHSHAFHSHEIAKLSKAGIKLVSKKVQKKFNLEELNYHFKLYISKRIPIGSIFKESYYIPPLILSNSLRAPPYSA